MVNHLDTLTVLAVVTLPCAPHTRFLPPAEPPHAQSLTNPPTHRTTPSLFIRLPLAQSLSSSCTATPVAPGTTCRAAGTRDWAGSRAANALPVAAVPSR